MRGVLLKILIILCLIVGGISLSSFAKKILTKFPFDFSTELTDNQVTEIKLSDEELIF